MQGGECGADCEPPAGVMGGVREVEQAAAKRLMAASALFPLRTSFAFCLI